MKFGSGGRVWSHFVRPLVLLAFGVALATVAGTVLLRMLPLAWHPILRIAVAAGTASLLGTAWSWALVLHGRGILGARSSAEEVLRHAQDGILTMDAYGRICSFNPAAEKLFGWSAAEVIGQNMSKLLVDAPAGTRAVWNTDSGPSGTVLGLAAGARELLGRRSDGTTFPLELALSDMPGRREPMRVALTRDVSQRKQAQRHLAAHYAVIRLLAKDGPLDETLPRILQVLCEGLGCDVIELWSVDHATNLLHWTAGHAASPAPMEEFLAGSERFTFSPGVGLPGQVWSQRKPTWMVDVQGLLDCPRRALVSRVGLQGACGFPVVLGEETLGVLCLYYRRTLKPDEGTNKMLLALGSQLGQFLQHKRAEQQLVQREQELADLVANAAVGIDLVTPDGTILRANRAELDLLGYSAEEYIGRNIKDFHVDQELVQTLLTRLAQGETVQNQEAQLCGKDGSVKHVLLDCNGLFENGRFVRARLFTRDLTAYRKLQEQFQQGLKMEAIGRLAGGVAHDFNNLLTVINGYCDSLLMALPTEDSSRESISEIRKAGVRATALTSQLLAFSRKQVLAPVVFDLNKLVGDMEKMLRRLIGEDIDLNLSLDPNAGRTKADPGQLEQVLMNLVVNARSSMPTGGQLTIATGLVRLDETCTEQHPDITPGQYALLSVLDTGCGMDEHTKAHLFEPFFTTRENGDGTGLGLATVYGIVKQSGGCIEVSSELGRGTTFRIYLPYCEEPLTSGGGSSGLGPIPGGQETILLVEDEAPLRALAGRILRGLGYQVLEADGGARAVEIAEQRGNAIHLLLTDVVMPRMSGRQLADQLTVAHPHLKVLYMSGYTDDAVVRHGVYEHSVAFLPKPFVPKALATKVREVLDAGCEPVPALPAPPAEPAPWDREAEEFLGERLCVSFR